MSGAVQNNQIYTVSGALPTTAEIPLSSSTAQPGSGINSNVGGVRRRRFKVICEVIKFKLNLNQKVRERECLCVLTIKTSAV
jgi:hypothetical protein